jgi:hypothetical protein
MNLRHMRTLVYLVPLCSLVPVFALGNSARAESLSAQDAGKIAVEAYTYAYPLIMMDVTRRQMTNIEAGKMHGRSPMNQFIHARTFPSANDWYQVANSIDRFAVGSYDPLKFNPDGSLDIFGQNQTPGPYKEANWLPAPKSPFNLTLRLYDPKPAARNGTWKPPAAKRVK